MRMKEALEDNDPKVLNPYRNMVIEEIAQEIEKFRWAFGIDTVQSFTVFIRAMKDNK